MEDKCNLLLENVSSILHEQDIQQCGFSRGFNLLDTAGISHIEIKMCKILSELLNPTGTHHMGSLFLKFFAYDVLKITMTHEELSSASVITEYPADSNRRIDIVIKTCSRFIPIEVKIYAADQPYQCRDYFDFAKRQNKIYSGKVYYLTLDGHFPSNADNELTGDRITGYDEIIPINFKDDICTWLDKCLKMIVDEPELYYAVKQYNDALKGICGSMKNDTVINSISKNSDTIKAACSIYDNLDYCRTAMLKKLISTLDERLDLSELGLERLNNEYDYKYDNFKLINSYYKYKSSTFPAIIYKYETIDEHTEIWFSIEVDHRLYCAFIVAVDGRQVNNIDDELLNKCRDYIDNQEAGWLKWRLLPNDIAVPNFKNPNDAFYRLFDDDSFDNMVEKCVQSVYKFLNF